MKMHALSLLSDYIKRSIPDVRCVLDIPASSEVPSFLDCFCGDRHVVIEHRAPSTFGISVTKDNDLVDLADEGFDNWEDAGRRIVQWLLAEEANSLRAIREFRKVSQKDLAARLGTSQPALSKLEHREEVQVSTLRKAIEALGGKLDIRVTFPDGANLSLAVGNALVK